MSRSQHGRASRGKWSLVWLAVLTLLPAVHLPAADKPCTLVPGRGYGDIVVGKTKHSDLLPTEEQRLRSQGFDFSFGSGGVLDTIVATHTTCRTDRGIIPGDTANHVRAAYGKPFVTQMKLWKGDVQIGNIGDKVLVYPGVRFIMSKDKVWAIMIVPKTEKP